MPKQVFNLTGAVPGVPYSSATKAGPLVFVSGQVGALDDAGKPISTVEGQTRQLLRKMKIALEAAGASLSDVTKTTVFLVNVNDFAVMNQVYKEFFPKDPARPLHRDCGGSGQAGVAGRDRGNRLQAVGVFPFQGVH